MKQQYLIEVSIPWTTLGQTNITPGAALGLDVHINEDDIPLRTAPLSLLQRLTLLHGHLKHIIKRAADDQELGFQYRLPTR